MIRCGPSLPSVGQLVDKLAPFFAKQAAVVSAYVFGSVAQGLTSEASDIDIAVRLDDGTDAAKAVEIRLALIADLEDIVGQQVDVVVLNDASLRMIDQVLGHGRPIHLRDPEAETAYRVRKQLEYFDFQYYLAKETENLKLFFQNRKHQPHAGP